jgi:hypothetical protein
LVPTRQQLIITEPLDGAHADLPMVRIMDAAVYMRPCQGGFLWGVYEEEPRFFDMHSLGASFDIKDMPLEIEVLRSAAAEVRNQLPVLETAKVREFRGGIPTMTADGHHILALRLGHRASILPAAAMSPDYQSRRQSAKRSPRGSSMASRRGTSRRCRSNASRTRCGTRMSCSASLRGSTATSMEPSDRRTSPSQWS